MTQQDYINIFEKYLNNQATPEEIHTLAEWLKEDKMYSSWAREQWENASQEMNPFLKRELLNKIKSQIDIPQRGKTNKPKPSFTRWIATAAAVLLLLISTGISIYFYSQSNNHISDTIVAVEKGQKANITLPDGTKVWINSGSEVTYGSHFNSKERVVQLKGEAFFDVTPDKDRIFTVKTSHIDIKVLGTSFNIKSYEDEEDISAVLMTGKVNVESDLDKISMLPNDIVVYNKQTHKMESSQVTDAWDYASWKDSELFFNAETFERIVKTLERYYNTQITFESEALKKYRFTGTLKNTSLESVLQILSLTSPLSYEVKDSLIILRENIKQKQDYERAIK